MPNKEIIELEKKLAILKIKSEESTKITGLKRQIKVLQRQENIKIFDKKHPVLGAIGGLGVRVGKEAGQIKKKLATPLTIKEKKMMEENQKRLKKLINMY